MNVGERFDLRDNVVVVTGAAAGIGLAFSHVLAGAGAHVVMADIDEAGLRDGAAQVQASGGFAESLAVDIGDPPGVRAAFDTVVGRHGRLDTVFANAGVSGGPGVYVEAGKLVNLDLDAFERVMHVNVTGTLATVQAAAAHMIPQRRGRIVITASAAALKSEPMVAYSYSISKAALLHLIRHAAVELSQHGVLVTGIAPGPTRTNLGGGAMLRNPEISAKLAETVPLKRLAEPEELQGIALYLASPSSSYMTGNVIAIDGGTSAW